jgi:hypothetical protein
MKPLVDELKMLMGAGIEMVDATGKSILVRGAVILATLDLPAAAKSFGFAAHNAFYACRRCDRSFPAVEDGNIQRDFSGGWDGNWPKRTNASNRKHALAWKGARNEAERQRLVRSNGTRWSCFHDLPYFDLITFPVFDPLHNIYLGSFRRIITRIFLGLNYLNKSDLNDISVAISQIIMPFGFETIPLGRKVVVGDGFSHFKGDEWRIFSLYLSPMLLKSRLPGAIYKNWMQLVEAVTVMSQPYFEMSNATAAHNMLISFCKEFERLHGKTSLYPNIHYHIHLFEQMINYGPMSTHTAFNFERYNQDLKGIRTNHKGSIETTIAKKFIQQIHKEDFNNKTVHKFGLSDNTVEELKCAYMGNTSNRGPIQYDENDLLFSEVDIARSDDFSLVEFINYAGHLEKSGSLYSHAYGYEALPYSCIQSLKIRRTISYLNDEQYCSLLYYYQTYFDPVDSPYIFGKHDNLSGQQFDNSVTMDSRIVKFNSITILGQRYSSSPRGSYIRAYYRDAETDMNTHLLRPCQIIFFFRHTIDILDINNILVPTTFTFAYVKWFKHLSSSSLVTTFDSINSFCISNSFMEPSFMDILPVHCIYAPIGIHLNVFDNCNIVLTLPRRIVE